MPDPRFFEDLGPVTLAELAEVTGANLADAAQGGRSVRAVAVLAQAQPDTVTIDGLGDFTRVPDKPAPGAVSSN